jgi:hypothetical protein
VAWPGTTSRPASRCRTVWSSLIGRLRDECLMEHMFKNLPAARKTLETSTLSLRFAAQLLCKTRAWYNDAVISVFPAQREVHAGFTIGPHD